MAQSLILIGVYLLLTVVFQAVGFGISQLIDGFAPEWSLLVFLTLFLCAYGVAWPLAVRLTEPKMVTQEAK